MTLSNIENGDPMAVYKESGPFGMTAGIAANNLFVAFRTAIFGVLASIGTLMIMLYNGIMVGAFQYFFIERGVFWESFLTIWIHGTLEISAIIIAGAAGLVAGSGLLFPGTYRRIQAFPVSMRQGLVIFLGIVPVVILAAISEGFLTRYTETPDVIRGLFIATSLFFVLWYFVWLPWHKARTTGFPRAERAKELPADRHAPIDFQRIKSSGEILADAFTMLRRHSRSLVVVTLGATMLFLTYLYSFSGQAFTAVFTYESDPWGVLSGAAQFFDNESAPVLYLFQVLLLSVVFVTAFRSVEKEMLGQQDEAVAASDAYVEAFPVKRVFIAILPIALVMPGMILFLRAENPAVGWLFSMVAFPLLALWAGIIYFETLNPFAAIVRTFQIVRWGPMLVLGLLSVNIGMLLFLFLDTPVWSMTLELFRWLVPPTEGAMAQFSVIVTTGIAAFFLYLFFLFWPIAVLFNSFPPGKFLMPVVSGPVLTRLGLRNKFADWRGNDGGLQVFVKMYCRMEDRKTIFYASVRASLKGLFSKYLILLCCCFLLRHGASAQIIESVMVDTSGQVAEEEVTEAEEVYVERPYTPPPVKPMAMRAVDKGKWDDATNGLDYSKDNPKPV